MKTLIIFGLVLLAGVCPAQDDWSYPIDPFFGVLHLSEHPGDTFPVDVNFMPGIIVNSTPVRMGVEFTYWPTPTYYWWDALTGPGILHGTHPSTAMARNVQPCPKTIWGCRKHATQS